MVVQSTPECGESTGETVSSESSDRLQTSTGYPSPATNRNAFTVVTAVAVNSGGEKYEPPVRIPDSSLTTIDSQEMKDLINSTLVKPHHRCTSILLLCQRHTNYYRLHLFYFTMMSFIGGCFIYAAERSHDLPFIDAYFTSVSAMCVTGLATINFADFGIAGQIITFLMIILGSSVLTSVIPPIVRWHYYRSYAKFKKLHVTYFRYSAVLEFLSVESLLLLIPFYFFFFQLSAFFLLTVFFLANSDARAILDSYGVNCVWFSLFHSVSAFNNAGFSLLPTNLIPFDRDPFVLLIHSILIVAGNTGYPVFLRAILWCARKITRSANAGLEFLWRFPRQSFTHLFTSEETLVLLAIILLLTFGEFILLLILDWYHICTSGTPAFFKVVDAFFLAISTRTAGFQVFDLSVLNPGMLMVIVGAMYLSSYPLTIAIRSSNNRLEDLYDVPSSALLESRDTKKRERAKAVRDEAQRLLLQDFTLIFVGMVIIMIIESKQISTDCSFSQFSIIFEVISAYGTVGLSLGYPRVPYSFSGKWRAGSKLVLIGIMLLGRHRGLPNSVDKALKVPSELETTVQEVDEEAVRVHKKVESPDDFPSHKISMSLFHTAAFDLDPNVVKRLHTAPNLDSLRMPTSAAWPGVRTGISQSRLLRIPNFMSSEPSPIDDEIGIRHIHTAM